jgi:hypothetical protein
VPDGERKAYPLRVDPALWSAVERSAASELRSVNAQVECLLREALAERGVKRRIEAERERLLLRGLRHNLRLTGRASPH